MVSIACRIRKTPKALTSSGRAIPRYVSVRPNFVIHLYSGTTIDWNGTIKKLRIRKNMASFPRKLNLENP